MSFRSFPLCIAMLFAISSSATAGTFFLDFDTLPEGVLFGGTSEWRASGGVNDSGYLKVTDAMNDQRGAIFIGDLDNGGLVDGFIISADLRVGGGTADPADGFSFNFASFDDPAILNLIDAVSGGTAAPVSGYADVGNPGDADLPEEGTTTGIGIGFDEWFSGNGVDNGWTGIDGGANSDPVNDVIGLSVRVDNQILEQVELPTKNGSADDPTSLQTGPDAANLSWANLTMNLDPGTHNLTIVWKDEIAFDEVIDWNPRAGALIFAGRTGGSNSNHHIDNLSVETFLVSEGVPCDFSGNGVCDLPDIDELMYSGLASGDLAKYDLNGDGVLNLGDRDEWLRQAGSLPGDANLDGVNNAQDLNAIGTRWQASGIMSIANGDSNGDGKVDASDLNTLGIWWTKTAADFAAAAAAPQAAAVPEPAGVTLSVVALFGLLLLRRK